MPRIFVSNFDFEHELAGAHSAPEQNAPDWFGAIRRGKSPARESHSDLAWVWMAIAEAEDVIVTECEIDPADFAPLARMGLPIPRFCKTTEPLPAEADWQSVPWGWIESLRRVATERGWGCRAPSVDVVRRVNSREYRFGLEREWNVGLDGAALAHSIDELETAIRELSQNPRGWILKANYGMSGREAIRGRGHALEGNVRNWAQRRLTGSGPIVCEPIVERIAEAGIQIEIPREGAPQLVGVTPLLVDGSGVYRGSRFGCSAEKDACWRPAIDAGLRTATELQRLGYFGPLGTDAMQYRDAAGELRLRPLQDLNARYTMGRLALGFCRLLPVRQANRGGLVCGGESMNIITLPPLVPPYEGGEDVMRGAMTDFVDDPSDANGCGTWLYFGDRHLAGRELWDWLAAMKSALPGDVIAIPASPRSGRFSQHRSIVVLAPTEEMRDEAEKKICSKVWGSMWVESFNRDQKEIVENRDS
jgi:hypothetical protein